MSYQLKFERRLGAALLAVVVLHVAYLSIHLWLSPELPIPNAWTIPILFVALVFAALKVLCLLSPRRETRFGGTEIMVFLALYALTVLVFASIYHGAYQADRNAFRLIEGADIAGEDEEIKKLLQSSSEDGMRAAYEKYKLAESRAAIEATECIEVVNKFEEPMQKSRTGGLDIPKYYCFTPKDRRASLLEHYTKDVDRTLLSAFRHLQERRARRARLTYVDFLYFSAVTGATVGYGDITPNTWETKLSIIGQIATSLFLTLVLVNLIINPVRGDLKSDEQVQPRGDGAEAEPSTAADAPQAAPR